MSREDLEAKLRDCASHSLKPLSPPAVDKLIEVIRNLEAVDDDVGVIVSLLT